MSQTNLLFEKLIIRNFMGCEFREITLNNITNIEGANRAGKSTIQHAISYVLTGKDAYGKDSSKFDIKNTKKPELNRGEHYVQIFLNKNGTAIDLKRVYLEKWEVKRGSDVEEFTGNTEKFFINGVATSAGDWSEYLKSEIAPETVLQMLLNPMHFPSMDWKDQRAILSEIAGKITDAEVIAKMQEKNSTKDYSDFIKDYGAFSNTQDESKKANEFKKHVAYLVDKNKKEKAGIQPKIEENIRMKPLPVIVDRVKEAIAELEEEIKKIDLALIDKNEAEVKEAETLTNLRLELNQAKEANNTIRGTLSTQYTNDKFEYDKGIKELENKRSLLQSDLDTQKSIVASKTKARNTTDAELLEAIQKKAKALTEWHTVNESVIPEIDKDAIFCDHCQRPLSEDDIDKATALHLTTFTQNKLKKLTKITDTGKLLMQGVELLQSQLDLHSHAISEAENEVKDLLSKIKTLTEEIDQSKADQLKTPLKSLEQRLLENAEYQENVAKISELTESINNRPEDNKKELNERRDFLFIKLSKEKESLNTEDKNKEIQDRIDELKAEEKKLAAEIARLQKMDFCIQEFTVAKVDSIEERLNGMFKFVAFKLFHVQNNGGIKETCEAVFDEVRFYSLNSEAKVNAALDIVNVLSEHYQLRVPIVLDNRESVTDIIQVKNQLINLKVNPKHKDLKITYE